MHKLNQVKLKPGLEFRNLLLHLVMKHMGQILQLVGPTQGGDIIKTPMYTIIINKLMPTHK